MPIGKKQLNILAFGRTGYDALICDGAVRSGKTSVMIVAFIDWAMSNFNAQGFGICSKTVDTAVKNIVKPFISLTRTRKKYTVSYKRTEKLLIVKRGDVENFFYIYGGKDEASYTLIQGITLAGVLLDEVVLMPQSFVEQALSRCSVEGAKLWFSCNPSSPKHWFKLEWIDKAREKNALYLHFDLTDNPSLSQKTVKRYMSLYKGIFYKRYILGQWVQAEGVIFPALAECAEPWLILPEQVPRRFVRVETGFDIGGNKAAYALTTTAQAENGDLYVLLSQKTQAAELEMLDLESLVTNHCSAVFSAYGAVSALINSDHVDVVINSINKNTPYRCRKAYKPPLTDRPFVVSRLLAAKRIFFVSGACNSLIDELQSLVFDPKSEDAIPLDDGSAQIDTWDSFIYSISRNWSRIIF